jgi:hypothetical protein
MGRRFVLAMIALATAILTGGTADARSSCDVFICREQCPDDLYEYCEQKCEEPATTVGCHDPHPNCTDDKAGVTCKVVIE